MSLPVQALGLFVVSFLLLQGLGMLLDRLPSWVWGRRYARKEQEVREEGFRLLGQEGYEQMSFKWGVFSSAILAFVFTAVVLAVGWFSS